MSASQHLSKKTYLEMGDEDKLIIEAYYYAFGISVKEIQNYVDWPWQSINAHIKIMEDRIQKRKDTVDRLKNQGYQTIHRLNLKAPEKEKAKMNEIEKQPKVVDNLQDSFPKYHNSLSQPKPLPPQAPFYVRALLDLRDRFAKGEIVFKSLNFDETAGVFFLKFGKKE